MTWSNETILLIENHHVSTIHIENDSFSNKIYGLKKNEAEKNHTLTHTHTAPMKEDKIYYELTTQLIWFCFE